MPNDCTLLKQALVLWLGFAAAVGCACGQRSSSSMLIDRGGSEIANPTDALIASVRGATPAEKSSRLRAAVGALSNSHAYSRLVAARALYELLNTEADLVLDRESASQVVENAVVLAPMFRNYLKGNSDGKVLEWMNTRFAVEVDGHEVVVADRLPVGWGVENLIITVNGTKSFELKGRLVSEQSRNHRIWLIDGPDEGHDIVAFARLADLVPDDAATGKYSLVFRCTVVVGEHRVEKMQTTQLFIEDVEKSSEKVSILSVAR